MKRTVPLSNLKNTTGIFNYCKEYNCEDFGDISVVFNISDECAYWRFNSYQNWIKYRIKKKYEKDLLNYFNN